MSDLERMQGEYRWHNDSTEWCTVRKRDLALLLAVAEAAVAWQMVRAEHYMALDDYDRGLSDAIAPLMEVTE